MGAIVRSMQSLHDVPAPAKLNLFLHITGRRADGYHLLQSVFTLIDWADTLHFDVRTDGKITREDLSWTLPTDDLTTRAARALQAQSQCDLGVHIGIQKSVPAQAGMGGGSSDAATTLLALNRLWQLQRLTGLKFNGLNATCSVTTDSTLSAVVPSGATDGPLSVTTPGGTAVSSQVFHVGSTPEGSLNLSWSDCGLAGVEMTSMERENGQAFDMGTVGDVVVDAFAAAFMHGLSANWAVAEIAAFANRLGGLVASRDGAIPDWTMEEAVKQ